jgi:hypothetical protein
MPLDQKTAKRVLSAATQDNKFDSHHKRVVPALVLSLHSLIEIVREGEGVSNAHLTGPVEAAHLASTTFRSPSAFFDTLEQQVLKQDGVLLRGVGTVTASPGQAIYVDRHKIMDVAQGRDPNKVGITIS